MSDVFLVLAQTDEGLSCFVVPRFLPDGTKNAGFQLQRLKDKLGNKSNASSEIEFKNAWGRMLGQPGRGVPTIIEMVGHTRLDCVMGSAGGMRAAVSLATWHAMHRSAFGKTLIDQPLMRNVLADLMVESEAATAVSLRLCRAYDEAMAGDERADHFKRLATAVAKYHVCKRVPNHAFEALECLGGNGYVENSGLPRLYREAPLCSIWEGSGNVMALDVLRALARTPEALDVFLSELDAATGSRHALRRLRRDRALASSRGPPSWSTARAWSSSGWRWRCRPRNSSNMLPPPCPTPSWRRGSATAAACTTARCRPGPTSTPSSTATSRR